MSEFSIKNFLHKGKFMQNDDNISTEYVHTKETIM